MKPDLTPLDFLWSYLNGRVYKVNPKTIIYFKNNISQENREIGKGLLERIIENFTKRLNKCKERKKGEGGNIIYET